MVVALARTRINRAFQFSASLEVKNRDKIGSTIWFNSQIIYNWATRKFRDLGLPPKIGTVSRNSTGYRVDFIYDDDNNYFCMLAEHPDAKIPGRVWSVDAEIFVDGDQVIFGTKVSYSTPATIEQDTERLFSIPGFVSQIAQNNGIRDVLRLENTPYLISSEADLESVYDLIVSEDRKLPVVAITERPEFPDEYANYTSGYLIDPRKLAEELFLVAHTICIPECWQNEWRNMVGEEWNVYGGAVRTYFPNADFDNDGYTRHPLTLPNTILASFYTDSETGITSIGGDAYQQLLLHKMHLSNTSQHVNWKEYGHKFFHAAKREALFRQKKDLSDVEALIKTYENLVEELRSQNDELELGIIEAEDREENVRKELDEARTDIFWQNEQIESLRRRFAERGETLSIDTPDTYGEMPQWIRENFSGRIVMIPRAIRALKDAAYEDVELVYKSVELLGTEYYKMRTTGEVTQEEFRKKCESLRVEDEGAVTEISAGELKDIYNVPYNGRKVKIERHLKKGNQRDPRNCMRIYYFWDDEAQKVVICSLPQHLKTRTS